MVNLWKLCPNVLTRCHHNNIYPLCDFSPAPLQEHTLTPDSGAPAPQIRTRRVTLRTRSQVALQEQRQQQSTTHTSICARHVRTPNFQFLMHCHHKNIILSAATRLSSTSSIQLLPTVIMSTSSFIVSQILPCQASKYSYNSSHLNPATPSEVQLLTSLSSGFRHNLLNHEGNQTCCKRVTTPDNNLISPLEADYDYYYSNPRLWNEL